MRTHIVLPDRIAEGIDKLVGKRNRSRFIADAAEKALRRERLLKLLYGTAGTLEMSRHPEWETPEKVSEWIRDLRDTPSIREQGEYALSTRLKHSDRLAQRKATSR